NFDSVENPTESTTFESNADTPVDTFAGTNIGAETLGKSTSNTADCANTRVPSHTGNASENVGGSTQAKVDFVNENTEGVKDNVVPGTPENASGPEKDRSPENVMPGDASDTNT
ncbi:hypothetical protein A2U01_0064508, partial [Trifolium medium]|nr:hypothetical protein [Trifolium medium]